MPFLNWHLSCKNFSKFEFRFDRCFKFFLIKKRCFERFSIFVSSVNVQQRIFTHVTFMNRDLTF